MAVKVSLHCRAFGVPGGTPVDGLEIARMAQAAGLHGIHLGDHVLMGERTDRYPYGVFTEHAVVDADSAWMEPITMLSAMSAVTESIRLAVNVLLAPLRPAAFLAKSMATLDVISGGRTEIGLGLGWQREEYAALNVDWKNRQTVFHEEIEACRALWGEKQPTSYHGTTVSFDDVSSHPQPAQPRLPILYGVRMTDSNAEHMAEFGDGWCPHGITPEEIVTGLDRLREAYAAFGRDSSNLLVRSKPPQVFSDDGRVDIDRTFEAAQPMIDAGVNILVMGPLVGFDRISDIAPYLEKMARAAEQIG